MYAVLLRFGRGQVKWRNALKKAENKLIGACPKAYTEAGMISPVNEAGCRPAHLVAVPWSKGVEGHIRYNLPWSDLLKKEVPCWEVVEAAFLLYSVH